MIFGNPSDHPMKVAKVAGRNHDLKNFLASIESIKRSFFKHSQESNQTIQGICAYLRDQHHPNSKLKKVALQNIKKTQEDVDAFKNTAISFQNSNNAHVRRLSEEFITLHKHATAMLEQQARFVSSPRKFSPSDADMLVKYSAMFGKQCEYIDKLISEAS
jgi:predicted RNA-binding protein with PUA-like domain